MERPSRISFELPRIATSKALPSTLAFRLSVSESQFDGVDCLLVITFCIGAKQAGTEILFDFAAKLAHYCRELICKYAFR